MSTADQMRYEQFQQTASMAWEAKCGRCGACCGANDGDPCLNLRTDQNGKYFCIAYAHRFGPQKTQSGKTFNCVPIRDILHTSWPGDHCCGYKR